MKRRCVHCKKEFLLSPRLGINWAKKTNRGRFCGQNCYFLYRKGKRFSIKSEFSKEKTKGETHPRWKGGKEITKYGYVKIYLPGHPRVHKNKVFEHIFVMEKHLGRYLKKGEVVHHIDRNKVNNNISNLMLFPTHSAHMKYERRNK